MTTYRIWTSPFGKILATQEDGQLTGCYLIGQKYQPEIASSWYEDQSDSLLCQTEEQLNRYAEQPDSPFTLPLAPKGTPFQKTVWQALTQIPPGETYYYQELAEKIGKPASVRAVAAAIGKNPLLIIIPCHRVLGKNGKLTGFAAGLKLKQHLLTIEAQA